MSAVARARGAEQGQRVHLDISEGVRSRPAKLGPSARVAAFFRGDAAFLFLMCCAREFSCKILFLIFI